MQRLARAKRLYWEIGDRSGMDDAREGFGRAARNLRDWEAVEDALARSLRLCRRAGDETRVTESIALLGHIMAILGHCHLHLGDYPAACVRAKEALAFSREVDFPRAAGMSLGLFCALALAGGHDSGAPTLCQQSVAVWLDSAGHPSQFEGE